MDRLNWSWDIGAFRVSCQHGILQGSYVEDPSHIIFQMKRTFLSVAKGDATITEERGFFHVQETMGEQYFTDNVVSIEKIDNTKSKMTNSLRTF